MKKQVSEKESAFNGYIRYLNNAGYQPMTPVKGGPPSRGSSVQPPKDPKELRELSAVGKF